MRRLVGGVRFGAMVLLLGVLAGQESANDLLFRAIEAYKKGQVEEAFTLANQAIEIKPDDPTGYFVRGTALESREKYTEALENYDRVVEMSPKLPLGYSRRGGLYFKLGDFEASIADFDKEIELDPDKKKNHWQRGISYFYAVRYEEGWKQFALSYRTVNPNDYENGIFHFLCMARERGIEKARRSALNIKGDKRPPMKEIYDLYRGKGSLEDVMQAAESGYPNAEELNGRLFYAHLYSGLYFDVAGDAEAARHHITRAVENFQVSHYMWDVARIHATTFEEAQ
jgi:lipoprotein NlpI